MATAVARFGGASSVDGQDAVPQAAIDIGLLVAVLVGAVLRLWNLGERPPIVDEAYTLDALSMPWGEMLRHLAATDPHPPLAYVLLKVPTAFTSDVGGLRAWSALAGILGVVAMAAWRRRTGVSGLVATALVALAPYQLGYAREVRMYGLLFLAGVITAWCADRWLTSGRRGWALGAAGAATVVAFSHSIGVLLLVALLLIPLRRTDRPALELRGFALGGLTAFAVVSGTHALQWSGRSAGLPQATLDWVSVVLNELIAPAPDQRWLALPLFAAGAGVLLAARGPTARVWLCLFAIPVGLLTVASLQRGVLAPRSLMPFSWGAALPLGALVGWAWSRWRPGALLLSAVLALLIVPLIGPGLQPTDRSSEAMREVFAMAGDTDGFAFADSAWPPPALIRWHSRASGRPDLAPFPERWEGVTVLSPQGRAPSRIWFVAINGDPIPGGVSRCGDWMQLGEGLSVACVDPGALDRGNGG